MTDGPNHGYISTSKQHHDERKLVLKEGRSFAVFDSYGEIDTNENWELGVYHRGTRHVSRMRVLIADEPLLLLTSQVDRVNMLLTIDLTNPDIASGAPRANVPLPRGTLHLNRRIFLSEDALYQRLEWHNYAEDPVDATVRFEVGADFADLFEVRGLKREARGAWHAGEPDPRRIEFLYTGLDDEERMACTVFSGTPHEMTEGSATFRLQIEPQQNFLQFVVSQMERDRSIAPTPTAFANALAGLTAARERERGRLRIRTTNAALDETIERAFADLAMLNTQTERGIYPFAGIPWFCTVFGRDGLWTALFCNWMEPAISLGVLRVLADLQATETIASADAEPGKILHEMREGEMAALGEVAFGRYYGSVDSTPLFIMLADAYVTRANDSAFAAEIWPNVTAALEWIDRFGDADGDGFVEYERHAERGLDNQGWKDSNDAVMHADGTLAEGPIALVEVQAYVFAAKRGAARLARRLGRDGDAARLDAEAELMRARFEAAFWCQEIGAYALALDGAKRQCAVVSSNMGHALYCGIASEERAAATAKRLMEPSMFTGWGLRTLSLGTVRYNPMSYHDGSVWPHDTAIAAAGLARYGHVAQAAQLAQGLLEAADRMELRRLPELFCGFERFEGTAPTLYPVACSPQAWSSASLFELLRACSGLCIEPDRDRIVFTRPVMPPAYDRMTFQRIVVGDHEVDLALERRGEAVTVEVLRRTGPVDVVVHT